MGKMVRLSGVLAALVTAVSVAAPAASASNYSRSLRRLCVVIGEQAVSVVAGAIRNVAISLNTEGKRLLAGRKRLTAVLHMLTADQQTSMISTGRLTLKAPPARHRGH